MFEAFKLKCSFNHSANQVIARAKDKSLTFTEIQAFATLAANAVTQAKSLDQATNDKIVQKTALTARHISLALCDEAFSKRFSLDEMAQIGIFTESANALNVAVAVRGLDKHMQKIRMPGMKR